MAGTFHPHPLLSLPFFIFSCWNMRKIISFQRLLRILSLISYSGVNSVPVDRQAPDSRDEPLFIHSNSTSAIHIHPSFDCDLDMEALVRFTENVEIASPLEGQIFETLSSWRKSTLIKAHNHHNRLQILSDLLECPCCYEPFGSGNIVSSRGEKVGDSF